NYLPVNKRTPENFAKHFNDVGLDKLVAFMRIQRNVECKKELQNEVSEMIRNQDSVREIGVHCKEQMKLNNLEEFEVTVLLWRSLMDAVEWNKKEDLVAEQALRHLNTYSPLLAEFTSQGKSETALILKIQDYCYDNMNFMKVFQKIIILLYKSDVLSEDVILKWYREDHLAKGKSVFLQQLQKFVEWLQNAEEESSDEEDS
ncbi:eIF5-mimic protein 1-like, partial [Saccoglossus kowalevskii]|uniref:Basic leucine zipper and W2 domain-containing protein 1-like n=1 Tax=Saccoglossus kowalevskii TaxID=10224 RepID=A0ABM0GMD4_SACKO